MRQTLDGSCGFYLYIFLELCSTVIFDNTITESTVYLPTYHNVCILTYDFNFQVTQCVMMWGVLLGSVIFGMLADKYGRKNPLMLAIIIQSVTSFIACVLPQYWWFLINWFILALASGGITIISFVICMEVSQSQAICR